jgi:hypothetical protein
MVTVEAGRARSNEEKHRAALSKAKALAKALDAALEDMRVNYELGSGIVEVRFGPIADISTAVRLSIFDGLAEYMLALGALKNPLIVIRFVGLDLRKPHAGTAFRTRRRMEHQSSRIEYFRLRHCLDSDCKIRAARRVNIECAAPNPLRLVAIKQ